MALEGRTQPTDDYEAGMAPGAAVLHRDKLVARGLAAVLAVCFVAFLAASLAYASGWGAGVSWLAKVLTFALTPLFPLALVMRTVVRTVVTPDEVQIAWGLWGPRIPVAALTACELLTPAELQSRRTRGGYEIYLPGGGGDCVWLAWTDEAGAQRTAVLGAGDPKALVRAIGDARARRLRIATPSTDVASEVEAERTDAADGEQSGGVGRTV